MIPDACTSTRCTGPCDNCRTSHALFYGEGIDKNGKRWNWEFSPYLGPVFLTLKGEPLKSQPAEDSPAWDVFEKWQKEKGL